MKEETKASHTTYENNRQSGIEQQEAMDAWRNKTTYPTERQITSALVQRENPADGDTYGTRFGNLKADL